MKLRLLVLLGALPLLTVAGCTTIGNTLGEIGPDREREAQLTAAAAAPERPAFDASAFCPEPIRELYMVMPEVGAIGKLSVTFNDGSHLLLEGAFAGAELNAGKRREFTGDRAMMEREFGAALAALPSAPMIATLYFKFGMTELNETSSANVEHVFRQIRDFQGANVSIVGHTDTVGSVSGNQELSESRAERVRKKLIELGVPAERIVSVSGRGENELLVPTGDNVKEERNRRVVITVR